MKNKIGAPDLVSLLAPLLAVCILMDGCSGTQISLYVTTCNDKKDLFYSKCGEAEMSTLCSYKLLKPKSKSSDLSRDVKKKTWLYGRTVFEKHVQKVSCRASGCCCSPSGEARCDQTTGRFPSARSPRSRCHGSRFCQQTRPERSHSTISPASKKCMALK